MIAHERTEYHWDDDRVVPIIIRRPPYVSQWRFDLHDPTLVATFEELDRTFQWREGRAFTPQRLADAIRIHRSVYADHQTQDFSRSMPRAVRARFEDEVETAIKGILEQWDSFAEETDITGHLKGELSKIRFELEGWSVHVKGWTYKRYPKENEIGADLGVIFDLIRGDERIIKAVWFQAKIDKGAPIDQIGDLLEQIDKMKKFTDEAYTLLFTRDSAIAMRGTDAGDAMPLSENLADGAACLRGDRNPLIVANTVDCKHVVRFVMSASSLR